MVCCRVSWSETSLVWSLVGRRELVAGGQKVCGGYGASRAVVGEWRSVVFVGCVVSETVEIFVEVREMLAILILAVCFKPCQSVMYVAMMRFRRVLISVTDLSLLKIEASDDGRENHGQHVRGSFTPGQSFFVRAGLTSMLGVSVVVESDSPVLLAVVVMCCRSETFLQ